MKLKIFQEKFDKEQFIKLLNSFLLVVSEIQSRIFQEKQFINIYQIKNLLILSGWELLFNRMVKYIKKSQIGQRMLQVHVVN